jgi:hypothetical protein
MSNLRVPARVDPDQDIILSATLDKNHNSICYAPSSKPKFINAILDAQVCRVQQQRSGPRLCPSDLTYQSLLGQHRPMQQVPDPKQAC